jgi:hypothetical protein
VGSYSMATEPVLSWKCRMVRLNVRIVRSHLQRDPEVMN